MRVCCYTRRRGVRRTPLDPLPHRCSQAVEHTACTHAQPSLIEFGSATPGSRPGQLCKYFSKYLIKYLGSTQTGSERPRNPRGLLILTAARHLYATYTSISRLDTRQTATDACSQRSRVALHPAVHTQRSHSTLDRWACHCRHRHRVLLRGASASKERMRVHTPQCIRRKPIAPMAFIRARTATTVSAVSSRRRCATSAISHA